MWRQESKQVVHSWKDSGLFSPTELCLHILVFGLTCLFIEQVSNHFKADINLDGGSFQASDMANKPSRKFISCIYVLTNQNNSNHSNAN